MKIQKKKRQAGTQMCLHIRSYVEARQGVAIIINKLFDNKFRIELKENGTGFKIKHKFIEDYESLTAT